MDTDWQTTLRTLEKHSDANLSSIFLIEILRNIDPRINTTEC